MKTTAWMSGKKVPHPLETEPTDLPVPIREMTPEQMLCLGFRANMLEMEKHGGVDTGTGLGTDFSLLRWGKRQALVRGSELLKAWVKTFAPKDVKRFPKEIK